MVNEIDWDKVTGILKALFFIILIIGSIRFTTVYTNIDYGEITENLENIATCEIDFKDFHYSGLCIETPTIYEFLGEQYNTTGAIK